MSDLLDFSTYSEPFSQPTDEWRKCLAFFQSFTLFFLYAFQLLPFFSINKRVDDAIQALYRIFEWLKRLWSKRQAIAKMNKNSSMTGRYSSWLEPLNKANWMAYIMLDISHHHILFSFSFSSFFSLIPLFFSYFLVFIPFSP